MKHPLIVEEIGRHTWAITDEAMSGILRAVESGLTADDETIFHAALGELRAEFAADAVAAEAENRFHHSEQHGNVGIVRVEGPIIPRGSAFTRASGIVSADALSSDLDAMASDPSISRVCMVFDSPGGAVTGVSELAAQIEGFEKPIVSYVYGMAASAAYWLAAATDEIISANTGTVGSIGTVMTVHSDKGAGRVKIISAQSPRKQADPETDDGRASYQEIVDAMADVFIDSVAQYRGTTREDVLEHYGRGGVVMPEAAQAAGMIDGVSTFRAFMREFSSANFEAACGDWKKKKRIAASANKKITASEKIVAAADVRVDGSEPGIGTMDHAGATAMPDEGRKEGAEEMNLNEFLTSNTEAKAEFEAALSAVRDETIAKHRERSAHAAQIAASDAYPSPIRALAVQVLAGSQEPAALSGAMAVFEMDVEKRKAAEAAAASGQMPETPPQKPKKLSEDGMIRNEDDFRAEVERAKGKR